jgi:hypothetical protein
LPPPNRFPNVVRLPRKCNAAPANGNLPPLTTLLDLLSFSSSGSSVHVESLRSISNLKGHVRLEEENQIFGDPLLQTILQTMKLDTTHLRYLSDNDFRVLTAVTSNAYQTNLHRLKWAVKTTWWCLRR